MLAGWHTFPGICESPKKLTATGTSARLTTAPVISTILPGSSSTGTKEVPKPPDPVVISAYTRSDRRCSGPVGGVGDRDFRPATSGEYSSVVNLPMSDSSPICSHAIPAVARPSVPAVKRAQLKRKFLTLYYQNVKGLAYENKHAEPGAVIE